MKTVHTSDMVCHLWANQSQSEARTGTSNLYFRDSTIYSYGSHFPIACHVSNKRGQKAVLFTSRSCSATTAGHKCDVRRASSHLTVFTVPEVIVSSDTHKMNLEYYRDTIAEISGKVLRARSNQEFLFRELQATINQANAYSAFFGQRVRFEVPDAINTAELETIIDGHKRKKSAEERKAEKIRKERQADQEREWNQKLENWKDGKNVHIHTTGPASLRINGDMIETSAGAEVPLKHAIKILPRIRSGKPYVRNGHTIHLGQFALDAIDEQGNITAGCHTITREEIERIAKKIGI